MYIPGAVRSLSLYDSCCLLFVVQCTSTHPFVSRKRQPLITIIVYATVFIQDEESTDIATKVHAPISRGGMGIQAHKHDMCLVSMAASAALCCRDMGSTATRSAPDAEQAFDLGHERNMRFVSTALHSKSSENVDIDRRTMLHTMR
jgi:hypothetical protein